MGCSWCKSRQPLPDDTTITTLLNESVIDNNKNQINPLLHTTTDEAKLDIIKPLKLIPDIRRLQSIIFKCIHENDYDLYPKYSKLSSIWNASSIEEEKCNISHKLLQISLSIALYTNGANIAYINNMYNLLDYSIVYNHDMILLPDLVELIISFISGIRFSDDIQHENKGKQLEFSYNKSMVIFKYMMSDYLNIRSKEKLVGDRILINCYVISKGDEMWIGLINKETYNISTEIEKKFGALLYYGGREGSIINKVSYNKWDNGMGAIHGFAAIIKQCEYYQSGDWISFLIEMNKNKPNCKIYKNGHKILDIDALPFRTNSKYIQQSQSIMSTLLNKAKKYINNENENNLEIIKDEEDDDDDDEIYFCVVVDDSMDGFIVEEVLYTSNII